MSKVWFITGASKGFGREFALGALERGDQVAATARNADALKGLVEQYGDAVFPVELDVTNRDQVFAAVKSAHEKFGRIDVVINNAGYGLFGTVEEITEQQLRDQLETNLFGVFHVTQASRSSASSARATSSRSRPRAASSRSRPSLPTMRRSGHWKG